MTCRHCVSRRTLTVMSLRGVWEINDDNFSSGSHECPAQCQSCFHWWLKSAGFISSLYSISALRLSTELKQQQPNINAFIPRAEANRNSNRLFISDVECMPAPK